MQFIANQNLIAMLRLGAKASSLSFIDTSGTSRTLYNNERNKLPFVYSAGVQTATSNEYALPFAASDETITSSTTGIVNQVGTTSITYTQASKGWTGTITVTGQENDIIRHLVFIKKLGYSSSSWTEAIIYALKLDNPVTIDSTGTASFTFAIEF